MKEICIIGTGWYGLYAGLLLKNKYKITFIEKNNDIFDNSSYRNQNRLHEGYHYPRSFETRQLCIDGYTKFINKFNNLLDNIENNCYLISNDSLIDYDTFVHIYKYENYHFREIENDEFANIQKNVILVDEKIINSDKSKKYFKNELSNCQFIFDYTVKNIVNNNNKVTINDELHFDFCFDCTFNQLQLDKKEYIYEQTISLLYKRKDTTFNKCVTIMDGEFLSLYPHDIDKNIYTLTHVKYSPLISSNNFDDVKNYQLNNDDLKEIIELFEKDTIKYFPRFYNYFEYTDEYFKAFKTKIKCKNDTRKLNIYKNENIVSVNCGKITGIFQLEEYIKNELKLI
jgi:hypothetical protein